MVVSEAAFAELALRDPEGRWELHDGEPRRKPVMSMAHNWAARRLADQLRDQLDRSRFDIVVDQAHLRWTELRSFIPDICVVPMSLARRYLLAQPHELEAYAEPLPLVVEVWSPSTGTYDVDDKLPEYQRRGDAEIWRIHPYERTLTAWRKQPDGRYTEALYTEGVVQPVALPGVSIVLAELFG